MLGKLTGNADDPMGPAEPHVTGSGATAVAASLAMLAVNAIMRGVTSHRRFTLILNHLNHRLMPMYQMMHVQH
jgi:hypothetical protein